MLGQQRRLRKGSCSSVSQTGQEEGRRVVKYLGNRNGKTLINTHQVAKSGEESWKKMNAAGVGVGGEESYLAVILVSLAAS